jgi:hypothetical protein
MGTASAGRSHTKVPTGHRANSALERMADPGTFNRMHQQSFKNGAANLYDHYDD